MAKAKELRVYDKEEQYEPKGTQAQIKKMKQEREEAEEAKEMEKTSETEKNDSKENKKDSSKEESKKSSSGVGRTRNWATVVYPESAPENWITILREEKIEFIISPLHDKDFNATGEPKKPHWHVIILFDSVKTKTQACEVFSKIGGVGCEKVKSLRSYARYLCHLDNPEKAQYSIDDVVCISAISYLNLIQSSSDKKISIIEMMEFCDRYQLFSFAELMKYSAKKRSDWFDVLVESSAYIMKQYMKSLEYDYRTGGTKIKAEDIIKAEESENEVKDGGEATTCEVLDEVKRNPIEQ